MTSAYGRILRLPGAAAFSLAGLLARFPMTMVGISTILAVQDLYGSYSAAGVVSAANVVATALGAPVLARLVDGHGQARVMVPSLLISSSGLLGLVAAAHLHAGLPVLVALATLAGAFAGSMGSLVRSRWTAIVTRPEDVHTAFSLEAALDEVAFIIGPVLATALCTSSALPVTSGWVAALVLQLGGGMWFLAQRRSEPAPHPRRRTGATVPVAGAGRPVLRRGGVLAVLTVFLFSGALFGANDVAAVSFATEAGHKSASGAVLAAWGIGSLTAALIYGSRSWGWPLWRQFLAGAAALAVGTSTFLPAPGLTVLCVLMVITGMGIAPTVTTGNNIVQVTVAPSQLTEGLAWVSTALNIGVSLGSMAAGRAIDAAGSRGGYLLVAGCGWLAVATALAWLPVLRRVRSGTALPPGPPH